MYRTPVWTVDQKISEQADSVPAPLTWTGRLAMFLILLVAVALPVSARWFQPQAAGFGTHQQIGLSACYSHQLTGMKCPTCGMTTAAAWLARGEVQRAWASNPAMIFLWLLTMVLAIWSLTSLARGRLVGCNSWDRPLAIWAWGMFSLALMTWIIRIYQWQL